MATRFQGTSASEKGVIYDIIIDDSDGAAGSVDILIGGEGFVLSYDTESEDPISPILSSTLEFSIIANPTTSSDISEFINDLITAEETRFRVIVNDSGGNLFWCGFILADKVYQEDTAWADTLWELRIQAIDGIGRLKDLEYNDAGTPYDGRVLVKEHLFNILEKIGLSDIWGATDDYLYVINRWYEDNMSATVNVNSFDRTYIDHSCFFEIDRQGEYKYKDCYEVLSQLMRLFLCRFYLSDGVYRADQISEYKENGSIYRHRYYSDGTKPGTSSSVDLVVEENVDDGIRIEGTRYYWFSALRKASIKYKHFNDRNYLPGKVWDSSASPAGSTAQFGRSGLRAWIQGTIRSRVDYTGLDTQYLPTSIWFRFTITCQSGGTTYYLNRTGSISFTGTITYDDAEWTTNSGDRVHYIAGPQAYYNSDVYEPFSFETPDLPGTTELVYCTVDFDFWKATRYDALIDPANYTEDWKFYDTVFQLLSDDPATLSRETVYTWENADLLTASEVVEYETTFADSENFFTSNALTVYDGSSTPVASSSWTRGVTGTGQQLQQLFLQELMKIRKVPLRRLEGDFYSADYKVHNLLQTTSGARQYCLLRGTYTSAQDMWSGIWMYTDHADSVTPAPVGKIKTPIPGGDPSNPPSPGYPSVEPWTDLGGLLGGSVVGLAFDNGGHPGTTTSAGIDRGDTVTSVPINAIGVDGLINAGDEIALIDPVTGATQLFTVDTDVAAADTTISVTSEAADFNFTQSTIVAVATDTFIDNIYAITRPVRYVEHFTMNGTDGSVTATVNGGTLPSSNDYLDVYYNGVMLQITLDYTVSGGVITFASWKPENGSRITIKFWI